MVFKNKETKIDSKDALSLTTFMAGFCTGVIAGILLSLFVVVVR